MIKSDEDKSESFYDFPKLMVNENVIAIMNNTEKGMVVARLKPTSVQVGDILYKNFDIGLFSDFHGSVELKNMTRSEADAI